MAQPVIIIEGLDELQAALEKFPKDWERIANDALKTGMIVLESGSKAEAPVDSGRLRSSIGSQVIKGPGSEIIGKVGSKVEYASYQEYGTRFQPGKPYLRPTLEKERGRVVDLFKKGIEKALRSLGL